MVAAASLRLTLMRAVQENEFESANRMFFLAIPPGVFVSAARGSGGAAASQCASETNSARS